MEKREVLQQMSADEIEKLKGRYAIRYGQKTLHIIGGCWHTKHLCTKSKIFMTEDEAIASETRYMPYCKLCFKK